MRRILIFLAGLALASIATAQESDGTARYRLKVGNHVEAQRVANSPLNLFSEDVVIGDVDVVVKPGELPHLWALRLPYQFVSSLPRQDAWAELGQERADYRTTYLRYNAIIAQYEEWRAAHPQIVTRTQIGTSHNGRAIWAYRILDRRFVSPETPPARSIVLLGGCHAREWIASSVPMHVTKQLIDHILTARSAMRTMATTAVYVVPVQNPDGYEFSWTNDRYWRKNRRNNGSGIYGVDLNRNYSTGWGGTGSSGSTSSATYRGPSAFSEPETNSLRTFTIALPQLMRFIDFHSYGQKILYPWTYTTSPCPHGPEHDLLSQIFASAINGATGYTYEYGQSSSTLYLAGGTSKDWFYEQFGALSYTIELRDTGQNGFLLPESQIAATQDEAWHAVRAMLHAL